MNGGGPHQRTKKSGSTWSTDARGRYEKGSRRRRRDPSEVCRRRGICDLRSIVRARVSATPPLTIAPTTPAMMTLRTWRID
jgi:hypothetical protein